MVGGGDDDDDGNEKRESRTNPDKEHTKHDDDSDS
jgi:hypothetical protein